MKRWAISMKKLNVNKVTQKAKRMKMAAATQAIHLKARGRLMIMMRMKMA